METIKNILLSITNLPSYVFVLFTFLLLGIIFKVEIKKDIVCSITIGAGVLAITTITQMMVDFVSPVGISLANNSVGLSNDLIDIGPYAVLSAIVSLPFFVLVYPLCLILNIFLIIIKWTKTINVDFMDLFAVLIPFIPVWILTKNAILVIVLAMIYYAFCLKAADITAPYYQQYYGLEKISITQPHNAFQRVFTLVIDWLIDKIPFVRNINFNLDTIQQKFGLLGNPIVLTSIIGIAMGLISKLSIGESLGIGVALATSALLSPKAVGLVIEGIKPISEKMEIIIKNKLDISNVNIGMNSNILVGYNDSITIGTIMMLIDALLYFVLPGIRIIPTSLAVVNAGMFLPLCGKKGEKGNAFRAIIADVIYLTMILYMINTVAPVVSDFCMSSGIVVSEGTKVTASVFGHPVTYLATVITQFLTNK